MARADDFNDRQTQIDAENEPYSPYVYQTEDNGSWAGALPVKQYVAIARQVRYQLG
jgi:glutamate synthase (NADPH/NADH)